MNKFVKSTLSALLLASLCAPAYSAVRPQLTRVVAYASDKETPVEIINESSESYMVQSWLEDLDGKDANIPLVLTPPVMRLDAQKQGKLRLVVLPAELPQDRESVYWLSIQEIPPKAKTEADNKVVIAIRSRLKVFVRPQGLDAKGAREAIKSLTWSVENDGGKTWLKANNPSAYYISFGKLMVNGTMLDDKYLMPAPHGSQRYAVPKALAGKKATITYSAMSDYGSAGDDLKTEVQL